MMRLNRCMMVDCGDQSVSYDSLCRDLPPIAYETQLDGKYLVILHLV